MVMVALLSAAKAAEKFLGPIRASFAIRIGFFIVDALHFVFGMQRIPGAAFIRVDDRSLGDA